MCVMLNYNKKTRDKTTRIKKEEKKRKGETKKKFLVATIATWYFNFSLCDDPMYGKNQKGKRKVVEKQ